MYLLPVIAPCQIRARSGVDLALGPAPDVLDQSVERRRNRLLAAKREDDLARQRAKREDELIRQRDELRQAQRAACKQHLDCLAQFGNSVREVVAGFQTASAIGGDDARLARVSYLGYWESLEIANNTIQFEAPMPVAVLAERVRASAGNLADVVDKFITEAEPKRFPDSKYTAAWDAFKADRDAFVEIIQKRLPGLTGIGRGRASDF